MKLNISYPRTGCQKTMELDEREARFLYEKRIGQEIDLDSNMLGPQFKGYKIQIRGGCDKQGFPMMPGVLTTKRVRLLLSSKHQVGFHPHRDGERRRKSVRGCVTGPHLSVLNVAIIRKGNMEIEGLTDSVLPNRLGPKRASKIRKMFNLSKEDNIKEYVTRRQLPKKSDDKPVSTKAPKIQRLVTPRTVLHKRQREEKKRARKNKSTREAEAYVEMLKNRFKEGPGRESCPGHISDHKRPQHGTVRTPAAKIKDKPYTKEERRAATTSLLKQTQQRLK